MSRDLEPDVVVVVTGCIVVIMQTRIKLNSFYLRSLLRPSNDQTVHSQAASALFACSTMKLIITVYDLSIRRS